MADDMSDLTLQRIVVKNGMSHDLATALLTEIKTQVAYLDDLEGPLPKEGQHPGFSH